MTPKGVSRPLAAVWTPKYTYSLCTNAYNQGLRVAKKLKIYEDYYRTIVLPRSDILSSIFIRICIFQLVERRWAYVMCISYRLEIRSTATHYSLCSALFLRVFIASLRLFRENVFTADSKVEELAISKIVISLNYFLIRKWIKCTKKFHFIMEFSQEKIRIRIRTDACKLDGSYISDSRQSFSEICELNVLRRFFVKYLLSFDILTIFREPINSDIIL